MEQGQIDINTTYSNMNNSARRKVKRTFPRPKTLKANSELQEKTAMMDATASTFMVRDKGFIDEMIKSSSSMGTGSGT